MSELTGVVLCSALQWPVDALGERPLLVFEPYDVSVLALEEGGPSDLPGWLTERGFAQLVEGSWTFPHEHELVLGVFDEFDTLALIDEGDDLLKETGEKVIACAKQILVNLECPAENVETMEKAS